MSLTTAAEWLSTYEEKELPSGKRVGLRKADPFSLIMTDGHIPDMLTHLITSAIEGDDLSQEAIASKISVNADTMEEMIAILNRVCYACMVSPTVDLDDQFDVENNVIGISHISFEDKMWMLGWTMGEEGLQAKSFPEKSGAGLLSLDEIPGISYAPSDPSGDKRKKPMGRMAARPGR